MTNIPKALKELVWPGTEHVLLGPIVEPNPRDKSAPNNSYFIMVTGTKSVVRIASVTLAGTDDLDEQRGAIMVALVNWKYPLVIHDLDDELKLAELACTIWPNSKRLVRIKRTVKEERGVA